jgi:hypothetical protein
MTTIKDPPSGRTDPPAADDHSTKLSGASALAAVKIIQDAALDAASRVLRLTVEHPMNAVCVISPRSPCRAPRSGLKMGSAVR